jgi:hypothetical protein
MSRTHRNAPLTPEPLIQRIETMRRDRKWSASRITFELD